MSNPFDLKWTNSLQRRSTSFVIHHPSIVVALAALLLSSCGFQLRGPTALPFDTLYVQAGPTSQFATQLRRVIGASRNTRVTNKPEEADATLQILNELREKEILSLSAGGRVRELPQPASSAIGQASTMAAWRSTARFCQDAWSTTSRRRPLLSCAPKPILTWARRRRKLS